MELVLHVLKEHTVSFHPHSRVFNVRGHSGTPRVVSFNPKATCSCPATFLCCHIVILSYVDLQNGKEETHKESLSLLRKNAISFKDKKSGRKRPCPADLDTFYSPAPEACSTVSEGT
jgi:hypothetical protein